MSFTIYGMQITINIAVIPCQVDNTRSR